MSLRASTGSPLACSGLMYSAVPMTSPTAVMPGASRTWAMPKSVTNARPLPSSSRMLSGFTSRCTMPWACAYASAQATSRMMRAASDAGTGPLLRMRCPSDSPPTYAIAKNTNPSTSSTAKIGTMLGWESLAAVRASRRKRSLSCG